MSSSTLFILGAGFSRFAGMPLVQHLRADVFEWLKRNGASDPHVAVHLGPLSNWPEFPEGKFKAGLLRVDATGNLGFEELMIELLKSADAYPVSVQTYNILRYACMRLLWERQAALGSLPTAYVHFAKQVRHSLGVVSFNWDLVCELALEDTGAPWGYSALAAPVPVIKPHGSLNWVNHLQHVDRGIRIVNPGGMVPIVPNYTLSFDRSRPFEDPLLEYDDWKMLRSITFPGDLENVDANEQPRAAADQERLWGEVTNLIEKATTVIFIGYSLPPYDVLALNRLSACRGKSIVLCNPTFEVQSEFERTFGNDIAEIISDKFEASRFAKS